MGNDCKVIKRKNIDFILMPGKVVFQTRYQSCRLEPLIHNSKIIRIISDQIETSEVKDLDSLAGACNPLVRWTPTRRYIV